VISTRLTVEDCLVLSSATLMRDKLLGGNTSYRTTLHLRPPHGGSTVAVEYESSTGDREGFVALHLPAWHLRLVIDVTPTTLAWGATRWWFRCPIVRNGRPCGRRCGKLYMPLRAGEFGCRTCHDLTYASCQESHKYDALYEHLAMQWACGRSEVPRKLRERNRRLRKRVKKWAERDARRAAAQGPTPGGDGGP